METTYRIHECVGKGSFGAVYRAVKDSGLIQKTIALKMLHGNVTEDILNRFKDEAVYLARLNDDAVIKIDDLLYLDCGWAIIMEYVEGVNLLEICNGLSPQKIPLRVVLEIIASTARVLDSAYNKLHDNKCLRLVHRDIKLSNIMITVSGAVKLLDFGVARADLGDEKRRSETHGVVMGTVNYMAPERLIEGADGPETDIYSLGAVFYELLTISKFKTAMRGNAEQLAKLSEDVCIPQELVELISNMVSLEPSERPTASEVQAACLRMSSTITGETLAGWSLQIIPELTTRKKVLQGDNTKPDEWLDRTIRPRSFEPVIPNIELSPEELPPKKQSNFLMWFGVLTVILLSLSSLILLKDKATKNEIDEDLADLLVVEQKTIDTLEQIEESVPQEPIIEQEIIKVKSQPIEKQSISDFPVKEQDLGKQRLDAIAALKTNSKVEDDHLKRAFVRDESVVKDVEIKDVEVKNTEILVKEPETVPELGLFLVDGDVDEIYLTSGSKRVSRDNKVEQGKYIIHAKWDDAWTTFPGPTITTGTGVVVTCTRWNNNCNYKLQ